MNNEYRTRDFNLAAYLMSTGHRFVGLEPLKDTPRKFYFVFEREYDDFDDFVNSFQSPDTEVNMKDFIWATKRIKQLLWDATHAGKKNENGLQEG